MPRPPAIPLAPALRQRATADIPLHRQLYEELREAILAGQLAPGARLPATRRLATDIGVSRSTVVNVLEQLAAEGYVVGVPGSGTFVAPVLPEGIGIPPGAPERSPAAPGAQHSLSRRGAAMLAAREVRPPEGAGSPAFRLGQPALDAFPAALWGTILGRAWRQAQETLGYQDPAGYRPLRAALASYLRAARGVHCHADQVLIVSGSQQALSLIAQLTLDPGDGVWVEDPGYHAAWNALTLAGGRTIPVPVDAEGLDLSAGAALYPHPRLIYLTPSHQFPLGVTMSLARRLALLEYAGRVGSWVLEDDYDSEFHYGARPLPALQGLDTAGRVIYVGTFSKALFPALRLGYLIVPPPFVEACLSARRTIDAHTPILEQIAVAEFIAEGHFARHLRRMRTLYGARQTLLRALAAERCGTELTLQPATTGLHLVGTLADDLDDRAVAAAAEQRGVHVLPLSAQSTRPCRPGLLLGYAAANEHAIRQGIEALAAAIAAVRRG